MVIVKSCSHCNFHVLATICNEFNAFKGKIASVKRLVSSSALYTININKCDLVWTYVHKIHPFTLFHIPDLLCKLYKLY